MGGVGVVAVTWALIFPPARPRKVWILGDTPKPPPEGEDPPLDSPSIHDTSPKGEVGVLRGEGSAEGCD